MPAEDDQASITLTPGATAQPPVAVNDSSLHNPPGPVTLNVTNNDTDPNLDLAVSTVDLNPGLAGQQTTRVVAGQGTWTVDTLGNVTFTPAARLHGGPDADFLYGSGRGRTDLQSGHDHDRLRARGQRTTAPAATPRARR